MLLGASGLAAGKSDSVAPLRLPDLNGQPVDPFGGSNSVATVFIFLSRDCPISNRSAPEIKRLTEAFQSRSITFWLVYPNVEEKSGSVREHTVEYQFSSGILRDPEHRLVRLGKVHVTPEVAVFTGPSRLVYHGRIDNRYAALGKQRPEATEHDLQEVLQAILDGRPIKKGSTPAIGCYISDAR